MSTLLAPELFWPQAKLGAALTAVRSALQQDGGPPMTLANPAADVAAGPQLERWLQAGVGRLGLHLAPPHRGACSLPDVLPQAGVLLARVPELAEGAHYAMILGPVKVLDLNVRLITPQGPRNVPLQSLEAALFFGPVTNVLAQLELGPAQTVAAARVLRAAVGGGLRAEAWLMEPAIESMWARYRSVGIVGLLAKGLLGFAVQMVLFATAWALVGQGALEGRLEPGRLLAFGLLLLTMVVVRAHAGGALARAVVLLSGLWRERIVEGLLRLNSDEVRTRGVGQLLGTVLEVDSIELLARSGGPLVIWVVLDLALGGALLAAGAVGAFHAVLLAAWLCVVAFWLRTWLRRLHAWTDVRLTATHELVEAMGGHRTLVAQDTRGRHTEQLRQGLHNYNVQGRRLDAIAARAVALVPRGWLVLGLVGMLPAFVSRNTSVGALATSVGGILLVWGALRRLSETSPALSAAYVGFTKVKILFDAAKRRERALAADVLAVAPDEAAVGRRGLLVARDLVFRYDARPEPVLKRCSFAIERADRVLLEGDSGGGKSTLGSILSGLRMPTSGVLLLGGFDHHAVGLQRWRQRAGGVPQFHENHIFAASLLFNLLLGRRWPPRLEDQEAAEAVCRELGLGPLVDRMPAGLSQTVGDSGWQLSHGERSRVFVARSLLARVDVRVFDESLAALDPHTSVQVMDALLARPEALVLIAHR